jgi:predicted ATPase/DNA-binding winged helix-turn-helix (wHTH) protein
MSEPAQTDEPFRFGPGGRFELRPRVRLLLADGQPQKVGARAFDLLLVLVQHAGRTLSKHELLDRVWPDTVVAENNLEVHVWALRKLLGAQAIVTQPGRGYRFGEPVGVGTAVSVARPFAAQPSAAARTRLPSRLPPLLGRGDELGALGRLVEAQALVSVVGGAGVGKTSLVLHLLQARQGAYEQGVCWVDLSALQDGSRVAPGIAAALGLWLGGGEPLTALATALEPMSLLLALDNAEHLLPDVAVVAEALRIRAGGVRLLVTSQLPLKIAAEAVFRLGPLAVPPHVIDATEAGRWGALALFEARVRATDRHYTLHAGNIETVRLLCQRLDGCALALELAAARVSLLGLEGLAASLGERLNLLTKSRRDAPPRQQSLRAALEWTHALMGEDERLVFRSMAVLAGGAALELLLAVVCTEALDRWRALDALDTLIERSLVTATADEPPRYRLLESPQALAREQLQASAERPALEQRHAQQVVKHFLTLDQRVHDGTLGTDAKQQLIEPELDNGRAALAWAIAHDPALAVAMARPLGRGLTLVRHAECAALWRATEHCLHETMPAELRAQWFLGAASFHVERSARVGEAFALRAAELFRSLNDAQGLTRALAVVATSRVEGAQERQQDALAQMRRLAQADWPASVLTELYKAESVFAYRRSDWPAAEDSLRRWMHCADLAGSETVRSAVQMNLAEMALAQGRPAEAARLGLEIEARLRTSRHTHTLAIQRMNLAAALLACDRSAEARRVINDARPAAQHFGTLTAWLDLWALLAAVEGRFEASARLAGRADADYHAKGESRETNQARAAARARALARAALGDAAFEREAALGPLLDDAQAGALALEAAARIL